MQRLKQLIRERPIFLGPVLLVLLAIGALSIVVFASWELMNWHIAPGTEGSEERRNLIQTLGQILGGVIAPLLGASIVLLGFYFTRRTTEISMLNTQITQDGNRTERFIRATDQLGALDDKGNKRLETRLGGIYSLGRLARESEPDYRPIMELLTAYIRGNAPWPPRQFDETVEPTNTAVEQNVSSDSPRPLTDIQAVLTVLGQPTSFRKAEQMRVDLDLRSTDLQGADLSGADLSGAYLQGANLSGADLLAANLSGANLSRANLSRANLSGANLFRAYLQEANFEEADFQGAYLQGAYLSKATLSGAKHLAQGQIEDMIGDETSALPEELTTPASWTNVADKSSPRY